jgi:UDP-glucose/iron transport system ATP-binding protein
MFDVNGLCCRGRPAVSFGLEAKELVCLSGPSGSGKTLLLRALVDLDINQGSVTLRGEARESLTPAQWRRRVGFLPAESRWWASTVAEHFSVLDEQQFGQLGLARETGGWRIERLSSGEKQRLALLRLLANRPEVLLLDEPTANLDAANSRRVETLVRDYLKANGASCLWVSHAQQQLEQLCDRRMSMTAEGRLEPA